MRSSRAARETHALHVNFSPHAARIVKESKESKESKQRKASEGKHRGGMTLCFIRKI